MDKKSILIATVIVVLFFITTIAESKRSTRFGSVHAQSDIHKDRIFSDRFIDKLLKKALHEAFQTKYANSFEEEVDIKFGKLLKKISKVGQKLGKLNLRTQVLPMVDSKATALRRVPRRKSKI